MLSVLAAAIYEILRALVPSSRAEITYADLVARLGPMAPPNQDLQAHDQRLNIALGELENACRQRGLPAISALVVRDSDRIPGPGYYPVAHPAAANDTARAMIAWGQELLKARASAYPLHL